jgi:hypothetical protein
MFDSIVRTLVPVVVGVLLGQAARLGLDLPEGAVTEVVTVVITTAYYAASRVIEKRWPGAGRVLLSLGLTGKEPVYVKELGPKRAG